MGSADGVLHEVKETNSIHLDFAVLSQIDEENPGSLFWDDGTKITLEKEFLVDLYLTLGVDFAPGHFRRLRNFPSSEITFVKEDGRPGWFTMYVPGEENF